MLNFPTVLASCHFCFGQNNATQYPKQTLKWRSYSTYLWNDSRVQTSHRKYVYRETCIRRTAAGSSNINKQIPQTDLHAFPLKYGWENLIKDQRIFPFLIVSLIFITFYRAPVDTRGQPRSQGLSYPPVRRACWREPWERGWREGSFLRAAVCLDMGSGRIHKR